MSSDRLANQVRIEQARQELDSLGGQIADWARQRREKDRVQQYHTQLGVLRTALVGCLRGLRAGLDRIDDTRPTGEVYADCRAYDRRLALVGRMWEYFKSKFDQRDDARLGPVLAAADEVVWSCYAEVFRNAAYRSGGELAPGPAPLPYIEPEYAPRAITRGEPPVQLRVDASDDALGEYLRHLPIPVVGLPPACVNSPWWLVFLGHEVGHHLQNDLVANWGLLDSFGRLLRATALDGEGATGEAAAERWQRWGSEVFADICSVCSAGTWAVWAMVELELADDPTMLASNRPRYPSPVVRLELLAQVADALGLDGQAGLRGVSPADLAARATGRARPTLQEDLELVPRIVAAAMSQPLMGVCTFEQLYSWDAKEFLPGGRVDGWAHALRVPGLLFPERSLRAARLVAAGAVAAWAEVARMPDGAGRAAEQVSLKQNLLSVLAQSREEGTRAASTELVPQAQRIGERLAGLLLEKIPDRDA